MITILTGPSIGPAPASIPSKYQTLVIDNSDKKGFLSKSKRFNYDLWAVSSHVLCCTILFMNENHVDIVYG